jgi:hypothetical protein
MGSTSSTPAALMRVWSLSAYLQSEFLKFSKATFREGSYSDIDTVIRKDESGV